MWSNGVYLFHTKFSHMIQKFFVRSSFALLFVLAFSGFAQAQFNETIRTGRPGQSINPFTVGRGMLQFQQGYTFDKSETETDANRLMFMNGVRENSTFENVIRYGIMERVEINAAIDYKWNYVRLDNGGTPTSGNQSYLSYEIKHRNILQKFGRYPHRNKMLGRISTAAEVEFLKRADSRF